LLINHNKKGMYLDLSWRCENSNEEIILKGCQQNLILRRDKISKKVKQNDIFRLNTFMDIYLKSVDILDAMKPHELCQIIVTKAKNS
jgi:hypothetical protein